MKHLVRFKHGRTTIFRVVSGGKELADTEKAHKITGMWKLVKGKWVGKGKYPSEFNPEPVSAHAEKIYDIFEDNEDE